MSAIRPDVFSDDFCNHSIFERASFMEQIMEGLNPKRPRSSSTPKSNTSQNKRCRTQQANSTQENELKGCEELIKGAKMSNTSVNCIHTIKQFKIGNKLTQCFIKLQVCDLQDPLVNEVIINQILDVIDPTSEYFPKYLYCCSYEPDVSSSRRNSKNHEDRKRRICVSSAIPKFMSVWDVITRYPKKIDITFFNSVNRLVEFYINKLKPYSFSHNDLHLNNIAYTDNGIKIIDFGRAYIDIESVVQKIVSPRNTKSIMSREDLLKIVENAYKSLEDQDYTEDVRNCLIRTKFQIPETYIGTECDMAAMCMRLLTLCSYNYSYLDVSAPDFVTRSGFAIDFKNFSLKNIHQFLQSRNNIHPHYWFWRSVAFFVACCCVYYDYDKSHTDCIKVYGDNIYISTTHLFEKELITFKNGIICPLFTYIFEDDLNNKWNEWNNKPVSNARIFALSPPSSDGDVWNDVWELGSLKSFGLRSGGGGALKLKDKNQIFQNPVKVVPLSIPRTISAKQSYLTRASIGFDLLKQSPVPIFAKRTQRIPVVAEYSKLLPIKRDEVDKDYDISNLKKSVSQCIFEGYIEHKLEGPVKDSIKTFFNKYVQRYVRLKKIKLQN